MLLKSKSTCFKLLLDLKTSTTYCSALKIKREQQGLFEISEGKCDHGGTPLHLNKMEKIMSESLRGIWKYWAVTGLCYCRNYQASVSSLHSVLYCTALYHVLWSIVFNNFDIYIKIFGRKPLCTL